MSEYKQLEESWFNIEFWFRLVFDGLLEWLDTNLGYRLTFISCMFWYGSSIRSIVWLWFWILILSSLSISLEGSYNLKIDEYVPKLPYLSYVICWLWFEVCLLADISFDKIKFSFIISLSCNDFYDKIGDKVFIQIWSGSLWKSSGVPNLLLKFLRVLFDIFF